MPPVAVPVELAIRSWKEVEGARLQKQDIAALVAPANLDRGRQVDGTIVE